MPDTRPKLLIVEDDRGLQRQLRWAYEDYQLLIAGDREEALEMLREHSPAVVTLDLGLPPDPDGITEGMAALTEILATAPSTKVVIASGQGDRESARRAISEGAWDFYQKPIDIDSLGHIVGRAFHVHALEVENRRLAGAAVNNDAALAGVITAAPEMMKAMRLITQVTNANVRVMLHGASGTGKALLARGLHESSDRAGRPFITVNCAAYSEAMLERALFGHEQGAASGVDDATPGMIEQAHGGTLFLDDVSALPPAIQTKLLHFLQAGVMTRQGRRTEHSVDTRIICATHRDMDESIAQGLFRADLHHRIAEVIVRIPSLAERIGDAVLLARHFVSRYAPELNAQVKGLAGDAILAIDSWPWPGNVRELENRVKQALMLAEGKLVTAADLDLADVGGGEGVSVNLRAVREVADQQAIRRALARADGNISSAARLLGISRPTLYDLLKTYNLRS